MEHLFITTPIKHGLGSRNDVVAAQLCRGYEMQLLKMDYNTVNKKNLFVNASQDSIRGKCQIENKVGIVSKF